MRSICDRLDRRLRIAGAQGLEDRDMIPIALLDRARLRDGNPAVVEHEHIEIGDKVCEQRIATRAIDREMKLPVADQEMHGIAHRLLLDRERLFEAGKRRIVDVNGGLCGDRALDQDARLVDGIELIGIDRVRARDADLERIDLPADDARARALTHRDDPGRRERLDRAPHRLTTDREQRGEVPLARQFLPDLKNARRDERREFVADPFAHRAPADLGSQMRSLGENAGRRRAQTHSANLLHALLVR
jgi:hypothetical protein